MHKDLTKINFDLSNKVMYFLIHKSKCILRLIFSSNIYIFFIEYVEKEIEDN